jgi:hypothetical protein
MAEKDEGPKEQSGPRGFKIVGEGEEGTSQAASTFPINFGTFVLSLSTSTLVHLGDAPNPETGEAGPPDLPLAQQTIQILEMLQDKTRGNLDSDEGNLLEAVLHDLRMRFVRARPDPKD